MDDESAEWDTQRQQMVQDQISERGITDQRVLDVMRLVPRHIFVPADYREHAYANTPLPIGDGQTISQPFVVALMSQLLELQGHERVLEIGTGCGYQTAILCHLAKFVYSIERIANLAKTAEIHLKALALDNVQVIIGDGSYGLQDKSPFEAILVTAAAPKIPRPLLSQLSKNGGRLVLPVGAGQTEQLMVIIRQGDKFTQSKITPVKFVPLIGKFGFKPPESAI